MNDYVMLKFTRIELHLLQQFICKIQKEEQIPDFTNNLMNKIHIRIENGMVRLNLGRQYSKLRKEYYTFLDNFPELKL